ncbi:MAG: hypothetical protein JXR91_02615 [Deltaproteobacteria bacterium]|nr:hypothetical protein [Deltaproteobacteria bacterium]
MKFLIVSIKTVLIGIIISLTFFALTTNGAKGSFEFKFSHENHSKVNCRVCHQKKENSTEVNDQFSMKVCYGCHFAKKASLAKCSTCHYESSDHKVVNNLKEKKKLFPPDFLKGPTHKTGWEGRHSRIAGADSGFCANCHTNKFCQDCHTGKLNGRKVHPGDWLSTHGTETRLDNPSCMGCHRSQTFCIECHRRSGFAPDSPTSKRGKRPGSFHKNASPAQICRRAKTDILACASCHSESSCITCHARINPHPSYFSRNCKKLAVKNERACKKCHSGNIKERCK